MVALHGFMAGSIPARAGQPSTPRRRQRQAAVYPRPRGATCEHSATIEGPKGLSPPARGNRPKAAPLSWPQRSIPARAGQPSTPRRRQRQAAVYPRPRGATCEHSATIEGPKGLSPPARGNRPKAAPLSWPQRSIPARAGQPTSPYPARRRCPVYPRPRGATERQPPGESGANGLSPPARGNPCCLRPSAPSLRSIPARAGQPTGRERRVVIAKVYPRPRGATTELDVSFATLYGLSPPARGNRLRNVRRVLRIGSIPARAGQPRRWTCSLRRCQVYPRPRGATAHGTAGDLRCYGLSPPARGNLGDDGSNEMLPRSIPARAGQPLTHPIKAAGLYLSGEYRRPVPSPRS